MIFNTISDNIIVNVYDRYRIMCPAMTISDCGPSLLYWIKDPGKLDKTKLTQTNHDVLVTVSAYRINIIYRQQLLKRKHCFLKGRDLAE